MSTMSQPQRIKQPPRPPISVTPQQVTRIGFTSTTPQSNSPVFHNNLQASRYFKPTCHNGTQLVGKSPNLGLQHSRHEISPQNCTKIFDEHGVTALSPVAESTSRLLSCDDLSSQSTATSDPSLHFASPSLLACRRVDRNLRQTVNRRVRLEPSHSATPPSEHENKFVSVYPRPSVPLVSQISPPPVPAGIPFQSIHSASPFYSTYIPSFLPPEIPAVAPPPSTVYPSSVMHPMAMPYPPSPSYPALYPSMGRRRVRTASAKKGKSNFLCIDEMRKLADKLPALWTRPPTYRPRNQYEFYDGARLVSVDSTEDEDWNTPPNHPDNLLPAYPGPNQNRDVDEFGITLRDFVPWISGIMDFCGCAEKKPRRALIRPGREVKAFGPQLETVCLDCGAVLEHHAVPPELRYSVDRYDWAPLTSPQVPTGSEKPRPRYEGYKNWEVGGGREFAERRYQPRVPLPSFKIGPSRQFRNVPDSSRPLHVIDSDYHIVDDLGRVSLPEFVDTATTKP